MSTQKEGHGGDSPTPRAQPYYCPYCGEQDIRPGDEHGTYHCATCDRLWKLEFRRLGAPADA
jgi:transcription elongation factor Elf1